MRIAYLLESTDLFGGVQIVLRQAEELARRGHRVTVVSPSAPAAWFPLLRAAFERSSFRESRELALADVRVATFWRTVPPALEGALGPVFHLSQGYEGEIGFYREVWSEIAEIYRLPTRKLAISGALASRLEGLGFGPVENVGQAFDPAGFAPGAERAIGDPPTVLVVGAYEIDFKGVDVALAGLAELRRRGGRFRLRRVSYFPCTEEERRLALTDEYHHRLAPERMPFAYRASDVFVGGSRAAEGFGLPTLEALACGLPALLSDTMGQREIAGDAARYYREGDPGSLADALPTLFTAGERRRAREEGPRRVPLFDPAAVAARLEGAFARALAEARPAPVTPAR